MPPEIDEAAEIDTINPVTDDVDAPKGDEQSTPAESSAATDVKKPEGEDTLSVVRDVVDKSRAKQTAASSAEGVEEPGKEPGAKTPAKEPDNENYTDVPFHKHPRFKEVIGKLKTSETDAQRYRNVETFLDNVGLDAKEAADTLRIGGLIKTDPVAAWKELLPIVQKVAIAAGEMLPDDLKQMVAEGKMPRESAVEVSRSRAQVSTVTARTQWEQQRSQERQASEAAKAIQGVVTSWESERRTRDPNFDAKLPAIEKEVLWLQAKEGRPNTVEGVRAQLQKAYEAVVTPQAAAPPRQAKRPVTGGQVSGNVQPEIKTTLDAIRSVVGRRQG